MRVTSCSATSTEKSTRYFPKRRSSLWAIGLGRNDFMFLGSASGSCSRCLRAFCSNFRPVALPNQAKWLIASSLTSTFHIMQVHLNSDQKNGQHVHKPV